MLLHGEVRLPTTGTTFQYCCKTAVEGGEIYALVPNHPLTKAIAITTQPPPAAAAAPPPPPVAAAAASVCLGGGEWEPRINYAYMNHLTVHNTTLYKYG